MADAVVSVLLDKLATFLMQEGRQLNEIGEQFDEIRKEFQYMQNFIEDVDRVRRRENSDPQGDNE